MIPLDKHELTLKEFVVSSIEISKLASMIYGVRMKKEGFGFSEDSPHQSKIISTSVFKNIHKQHLSPKNTT